MRTKYGLIFLIVVVILTRVLIFNKDAAFFWADESRYQFLIDKIDEFSKSRNYSLLYQQLFNMDARPGAAFFYYPVAFLEWKNPNIPYGVYFNLIVNILNLMMIYFIVKRIQNNKVAILVTLILTFSITSFIYMRHLLPYDIALLLLLTGFSLYVYFQKSFTFGLLAGLSFLTYPSYYYYIVPIPFILILYQRSIKSAFLFILGITTILLLTQLLSNVHTTSYFQSLKDQSGGVTAIQQGDYIPAVSYIGEYILATDGYFNLFLILAIFPGLFLIKNKKKIGIFVIYLILVFLILEVFSHILKQHVLYSRTVRPLYLFSLTLAVVILEKVFSNFKSKKIYIYLVGALVLITILNWLPRFLVYKNLIYPKQFQKTARDYLSSRYEKYEIEDALFVNYWDNKNPDPNLIWHFFKPGEKNKFYTMNAIQTFPYYGNFNLDNFCKHEVLLKEPHIQYIFKPYRFEGYKKVMRDRMEEDPLYYQLIYCKK